MVRSGALTMDHVISVVTVTLNRPSLRHACESVNAQTFRSWHHYVLGDGLRPTEYEHPQRSTLGFSRSLGAEEPGRNMPDGTPNPLLRWALTHLELGEYVCFLDDDNVYRPDFLEKLIEALLAHPDVGIVLCAAADHRYGLHKMDGYPEPDRCDNSAFLARSELAKTIDFPLASPHKDVVQDIEFIQACAQQSGWIRVPDELVLFGINPNPPPRRDGIKIVYSWSLPIRGAALVREGRFNEGIKLLREAIEFDPNDAWATWHLGEALCRSGQIDQSKPIWLEWDRLVELAGGAPHDWIDYCRALVQLTHGTAEIVSSYLERAIKSADLRVSQNPENFDDQLNRVIYRIAHCRSAEALDLLATVVEKNPPGVLRADAIYELRLQELLLPVRLPEIRNAIKMLER